MVSSMVVVTVGTNANRHNIEPGNVGQRRQKTNRQKPLEEIRGVTSNRDD